MRTFHIWEKGLTDIHLLARRNKSAGAILSYDALPASLKTEMLVRTKTEHEDEDELKER